MLNPLSYINQGWRAVLTAYPAGPVVTFLSLFPEVGLDLMEEGRVYSGPWAQAGMGSPVPLLRSQIRIKGLYFSSP